MQEQHPLILDDLRSRPNSCGEAFPDDIASGVCVPLYASGHAIGALIVGAREPHRFGRNEVAVLEQLTPHVAVAIRNTELLENLQRSLHEVTEAREKLHEVNEELKTLDEMKTNLLSNVSHELRTPLVAVMGYTDMILNGKVGPINEVQREYLGISLRNIEKLVTLIENLLDFSRLHRGAEEMVYDTLDLVDCARMSIQIVQPVADSREIRLILKTPRDENGREIPVIVDGDKGKLGQVFNNLLSNAVKFNSNGGSVTIEMWFADATVEVSVIDTGIGIPEDALDKVFTRFYQVDGSSTRKYGGTGIGLAIAQDIMRLHGSRLTVASRMGEGSTFHFSLNLSGAHQRREGADGPRLPIPTETHLLIELVSQDRALSGQIRNLLYSENMDIIHAAFPSVAVSLANRYMPDCILVDTESGPLAAHILEEILADPSVGAIPICLLTNDDALYERFRGQVTGRVKRSFRKSTLLSGIHFALSRGVGSGEQLGNKILCVDDDPEIATFIARCLEADGYSVDRCDTGEAALERVRSGDYWLVLLDIAMPGIDGWETCRQMKTNATVAGLKVYMVTAKPIDKTMSEIRECGADGYLLKPFKAEELLALVQGFEAHRPKGD
jgi:signal transduction histidine kinase/DNA-binding response OmpR family regulator